MTLTKHEFLVLRACAMHEVSSQRGIAEAAGLSLGSVNGACKALMSAGLLDFPYKTTKAGLKRLDPYRVENAVIMAAGFSSRFAPISYDKPKGVLRVRGEVLIERQIRQLQEAGIENIIVVVGYMKESFFYLEDKFGVTIAVNEAYTSRNNNSTLMLVKEHLGNTYVCSSDDYFTENVFSPYEYKAYYSAVYFEGKTDEYCLTTGSGNRITEVSCGGADAYGMLGHVYFDRAFSRAFIGVLEEDYDKPETASKLWEDVYIDHIKELDMTMKPFDKGVVYEFDSLDDLRAFDQDFIENVDSEILDNICTVLGCSRGAIVDIEPIKEGLTNLSFRFTCNGSTYVYRHPGAGTEEIVNRDSEAFSQSVAKSLGIDDTFIFEDPAKGWKLSAFVADCVAFDYHDADHVERALALIRRLHTSGVSSPWSFDVYEKAQEIVALLGERSYPSFPDFGELADRAERLSECVRQDGVEKVLCHNDFYNPNFLVRDDVMYLVDWEYSAMSDYANDLGTFVCCSDYTVAEAEEVFARYFDRKPSEAERRHCLAYVSISAYYWFVWALYKESAGDPVGEWLYLWYRAAKTYGKRAMELYGT